MAAGSDHPVPILATQKVAQASPDLHMASAELSRALLDGSQAVSAEQVFQHHLKGLSVAFQLLENEKRQMMSEFVRELTVDAGIEGGAGETYRNVDSKMPAGRAEAAGDSGDQTALPENKEDSSLALLEEANDAAVANGNCGKADFTDCDGTFEQKEDYIEDEDDTDMRFLSTRGSDGDGEPGLNLRGLTVRIEAGQSAWSRSQGKKMYFRLACKNGVPAFVILANSFVVGLSQDDDPDKLVWLVLETCFVIFYICELIVGIKIAGSIRTFYSYRQLWNWFDTFCACTGLIDCGVSWIYTLTDMKRTQRLSQFLVIKVFRLARVVRLIRLARHRVFDELRLMVIGLAAGSRVLFWSFVLLMMIVYILGVTCSLLIDNKAHEEFRSLDASMFTVFRCITGDCTKKDGRPLAEEMREQVGELFSLAYVLITVCVTIGVFNLITAIFIDNVTSSQVQRKQRLLSDNTLKFEADFKMHLCRLLGIKGWKQVAKARLPLRERIRVFDGGLNKCAAEEIPRILFNQWLEDRSLLDTLEEAEVEVSFAQALFDSLDANGSGALGLEEICDGFVKLRGPVGKSDVIGMSLRIDLMLKTLDKIAAKFDIHVLGAEAGKLAASRSLDT
eukprot:TRINITY_DN73771_c0_g1_i1.p1 TRINITY_DN73771_c0_g1~~TRINITY_DN73771_c0_g1_i1.p1  ORF type:complete len:628 (+),score=120.33 TRINITY_DN73771_c0_g1_i1:32-1885(+)